MKLEENYVDVKLKLQNFVVAHQAVSKRDMLDFLIENSDLSERQRENLILNMSRSLKWDIWSLQERGMYGSKEYINTQNPQKLEDPHWEIREVVNTSVKNITDELNKTFKLSDLIESKEKEELFHGIIERLRSLTEFVNTANKVVKEEEY